MLHLPLAHHQVSPWASGPQRMALVASRGWCRVGRRQRLACVLLRIALFLCAWTRKMLQLLSGMGIGAHLKPVPAPCTPLLVFVTLGGVFFLHTRGLVRLCFFT
jgi:hypothetical protein